MKQYRVHVVCDWEDWFEAESEEDAIDQAYDVLDMLEHDVYVSDVMDDEEEE
jgi:hypothetical protein